MFLMFHLHRPDLLPLALTSASATASPDYFAVKGAGKNDRPRRKKDGARMEQLFAPFAPKDRSVATWYMWRDLEEPKLRRVQARE